MKEKENSKINQTGLESEKEMNSDGCDDMVGVTTTTVAPSIKSEPCTMAPSPNFANIYSFFAKMFDPQSTPDIQRCVSEASMSALDKEVVKLLTSNLEANISNKAFRQKLLETYKQQLMEGTPEPIS